MTELGHGSNVCESFILQYLCKHFDFFPLFLLNILLFCSKGPGNRNCCHLWCKQRWIHYKYSLWISTEILDWRSCKSNDFAFNVLAFVNLVCSKAEKGNQVCGSCLLIFPGIICSQNFLLLPLCRNRYWHLNIHYQHASHTVIFAQLHIEGKNQGVHAFVAQIRDADGNICPNIRIADCGHKIGLNGVDNGRIW